jgi:hypothetical protein
MSVSLKGNSSRSRPGVATGTPGTNSPSSPLTGSMRQRAARITSLACALLVLGLCAESLVCSGANAPDAGCPDSGVRIYLDRHGKVTVNGKSVGLENLGGTLAAIQPRPTVVCYSRDDLQREPPAQASAVMSAIMSLRLPIGFFTDKTYRTPVQSK